MDQKTRKQLYEQKYRALRKEEIASKARSYYLSNKERINITSKAYRATAKDKIKTYQKEYRKAKYQNDLEFRLSCILRARLWGALQNNHKAGSAVKDLGCTIQFLKTYLESKFLEGMNWDNYGKWEIDHVVPLSKFNLMNPDQVKLACNYTNLQPLWELDNIEKSNK